MSAKITISDLIQQPNEIDMRLVVLSGENSLDRVISVADVNRPGLCLTGFYEHFAYDRFQIFGKGECAYLNKMDDVLLQKILDEFFSYNIFCCIFTHNMMPPQKFIDYAKSHSVPVLVTDKATTLFINQLMHLISEAYAPKISIHATFIDVFGIGVLLHGKSGVGKSETALDLIERGHRLIADDIVEIKRIEETILIGSGSKFIKHHLEIRGIGIINVRDIYGIKSVRNSKRIELAVKLEDWQQEKTYDRLGIDESCKNILDVDIPYVEIPVRPGRNIPIIVETAALNQRLKKMGVHAAREFDKKLQDWMLNVSKVK